MNKFLNIFILILILILGTMWSGTGNGTIDSPAFDPKPTEFYEKLPRT